MPISLSSIMAKRAKLTISVDEGQELNVTYRVYSVKESEQYVQRLREPGAIADVELSKRLADIVVDWDLVDDDGEKVPLDYEHVAELPPVLVGYILRKVTEDVIQGKT